MRDQSNQIMLSYHLILTFIYFGIFSSVGSYSSNAQENRTAVGGDATLILPIDQLQELRNDSEPDESSEAALDPGLISSSESVAEDPWANLTPDPKPISIQNHKDVVSFANGDFLAGQLSFWDVQTKNIRWMYPESKDAFGLKADFISRLMLEPEAEFQNWQTDSDTLKPEGSNRWQFFLTSGEIIHGTIERMETGQLHILSDLLGAVTVPTPYIRSIYPDFSQAPVLYRGPTPIADWTSGNVRLESGDGGQWRFNKNAFYATKAASIARLVDLPPLSSIEVEVAWKGTLNFALALYTDHLQPIRLADKENEPDFGPFYSLQIGSQSARLQAINKKDPDRPLGYAFIPTLNQKTRAKFTILTDSRSASVTLLVDDKRVHTWRDTQGFFAKGKGIRVVHQGMGSIRVGSLVVRKWNGIISSSGKNSEQFRNDVVQTRSGISQKGKIQSVKDGTINLILMNGNPVTIPLAQTHSIHFQATAWKKPSTKNIDTAIEFYTSESLNIKLARIDAQGIYFDHSVFGKQFIPTPTKLKLVTPVQPGIQ